MRDDRDRSPPRHPSLVRRAASCDAPGRAASRVAGRGDVVEIEAGLDAVGLSYDEEMQVAVGAARLGYGRLWTGSLGDPFQTCALRWAATRDVVPGGIGTAIGVVPIGVRTPADLASSAAATSQLTGGRFVLGLGSGNVHRSGYRRTWGIGEPSPLALVRAYLVTVHDFLAGEPVTHRGGGIDYDGARLPGGAPPTPLYVGAVGPEMARLAGELADGVYLSWCTPENVRDMRERVAEGAARAGRDPAAVRLAASVRVSVDDDPQVARRALAAGLLPYVLGWDGTPPRPFRANFERMGFASELAEIDGMVERGLARREIVEAFPERMLAGLGYYGAAAGAADALRQRAAEADVAVVRLVPARPGADAVHAILDACQPRPVVR
jgi:alkanesulfonate monooxygenase SsuD/methylene tetrahydromethanopterin reductase-like flavin-dependent oxidoreductase (luciferase family)